MLNLKGREAREAGFEPGIACAKTAWRPVGQCVFLDSWAERRSSAPSTNSVTTVCLAGTDFVALCTPLAVPELGNTKSPVAA